MTVVSVRKKSSAVSVSIFPALGRRESAPSWPLGLPVAKKNVDAHKGVVRHTLNVNAAPIKVAFDTALLIVVIGFIPFGFGTLAFASRTLECSTVVTKREARSFAGSVYCFFGVTSYKRVRAGV